MSGPNIGMQREGGGIITKSLWICKEWDDGRRGKSVFRKTKDVSKLKVGLKGAEVDSGGGLQKPNKNPVIIFGSSRGP